MEYKIHEYALIFPEMSEEDYKELKDDIAENGQLHPIYLYEGKVLDGRHRYQACVELGIEPVVKEYEGTKPLAFVISGNSIRRHLTKDQLSAIAVDLMPLYAKEAEKRMKAGVPPVEKFPQGTARDMAGRVMGVSGRYVSEAARIRRENPEVFEEIKRGEKTISEVSKMAKELERKKKNEQLKVFGVPDLPEGKYATLVIDPPWPMEKIDRDVRPNQSKEVFEYPTMDEDELIKFPVPEFSADDAHLYLWVTQKYLPLGLRLAEHWGFKYQCLMTWVKNVGFTPFSWMYSTEHVIFATKGSLPLLQLGLRLDFNAKVREHSRKPDEFYDLVKKVSPGPRIDVFSREKREGFDQYGNETDLFQHATSKQ